MAQGPRNGPQLTWHWVIFGLQVRGKKVSDGHFFKLKSGAVVPDIPDYQNDPKVTNMSKSKLCFFFPNDDFLFRRGGSDVQDLKK